MIEFDIRKLSPVERDQLRSNTIRLHDFMFSTLPDLMRWYDLIQENAELLEIPIGTNKHAYIGKLIHEEIKRKQLAKERKKRRK